MILFTISSDDQQPKEKKQQENSRRINNRKIFNNKQKPNVVSRQQGRNNGRKQSPTAIPQTNKRRTTQRNRQPNTFSTTLASFDSLLESRRTQSTFHNFLRHNHNYIWGFIEYGPGVLSVSGAGPLCLCKLMNLEEIKMWLNYLLSLGADPPPFL